MFFKHVTKELSAYCHEELTAEESRRVAEHLIRCSRCRADYELVKLGIKLAEHLPQVSAPESLWSDLEFRTASSNKPAEGRRGLKAFIFLQPRFAAIAATVVLAIGLIAVVMYRREARPFWEVASLDGAPRIGSSRIGEKGRLGLGQWLETDAASRAQISVGRIGQVEIDPNTRVRLLETKPTEHRLELERGRLSARIWAPPKLFFVDTPSAVAADLGCAYTLAVDDQGGSLLRVTAGWVALQVKDRESMVPSGAACATRKGIGPGTPYFEDASEEFRRALARVDFEGNPNVLDNMRPLEIVLVNARVRDTLTLWHLLPRVAGGDRELVFDRLSQLIPPPADVTRAGVLALDQQMLASWNEKLRANWSDYSSPAMKVLRKV